MLALALAASALSSPSTSLTWQRQHLIKSRHAALACYEARLVRRPPTDHAERSHSIAYLNATRLHWKMRQANCERRLAKDRVRWRRDPVGHAKQIAHYLLRRQRIDSDYWMLDYIIMHESSWHVWALNPSSGACGIGQALPCSSMAWAGSDYRTNPHTQLVWMIRYCRHKYGSIGGAYAFKRAHGWY